VSDTKRSFLVFVLPQALIKLDQMALAGGGAQGRAAVHLFICSPRVRPWRTFTDDRQGVHHELKSALVNSSKRGNVHKTLKAMGIA
jgi:hypothetical protein